MRKIKTWLCKTSEAESMAIINEFCAVDIGTTPHDNDDNRCIILVDDNATNNAIAARHGLEDVSEDFDDLE